MLYLFFLLGSVFADCSQFEGIIEAKVESLAGVPQLIINDKPVLPIIFFYNINVQRERTPQYMRAQVKLAADAGVHMYSFGMRCPRIQGRKYNYAYGEKQLQSFVDLDPQAMFILRVYPGPHRFWRIWRDIPPEHISTFADGTNNCISIASDYFWEYSNRDLTEMIQQFESGPFGERIIGYHIGGPDFEMFMDSYREKGPDYCTVNQRRFRQWLKSHYRDNKALQKAWGNSAITFDRAEIPKFEPGRFPMGKFIQKQTTQVFYDIPAEQDWIDYSKYCSDIVADRIIDWAKLVKKITNNKKITVFCHGYTFDLPGSISGHYQLQRTLACPQVDILMSPYSYMDRFAGGAGNFMSPVDSVIAHGKLWLNEDDTRTHLVDTSQVTHHYSLFNKFAKDMHESLNILDRNFASLLVHRAATWWMDLAATGAFNHQSLWALLEKRMPLYQRLYDNPKPYRPEVAVIVDEESKFYVKSDWYVNKWNLIDLRDQSVKSGASVGYYLLDDFISGLVPRCKVYVFANAFRLTDRQIYAVRARLDAERATAVWIYAPGYIGSDGFDIARASRLTGIQLAVTDGLMGSRGIGLLDSVKWGLVNVTVTPRLSVTDSKAEILGHYLADKRACAAQINTGGYKSIFIGDIQVSSALLRRIFESAGVHIWTRDGEVVQCDGSVVMIHSGKAGLKTVYLPKGIEAQPIDAKVIERQGNTLLVDFKAGDTVWFKLLPISTKR